MPAKTSSEARAAILALHGIGLTSRKIVEALKKQNYSVSKSTVTSVVRDLRNAEAGIVKPPRRIPPQNLPSVRTKDLIGKVKKEIRKSGQLTKRQIAKKYEVSVNTICRIIKHDLSNARDSNSPEDRGSADEEEEDANDDEAAAAAAEKAKRRERRERKGKVARADDDASSERTKKRKKSSKSSSSRKKKSVKAKIPKVRRRRDSPVADLLQPHGNDEAESEDSL
ncbi:hypothetical protein BV898_06815 [Hypsibius exemplaris]|uniref:Uncharacterized protein n=1 Tax=Hypsibius exemplaris TaxID=2072580 RepID=A0A1W0WVE3_HYPEX|nr:hypothetical protein BV898_06815 [Hypsibius exemplaris]